MISSNISSRSIIVFFSFTLMYLIIIANLYVIQVVKGNYYAQLGEKQYSIKVTTNAIRGDILDRHGQPLAINSEGWSAFMLPNKLSDSKRVSSFLQDYFPEAFKRFLEKKQHSFMYVKRKLTPAELELIETHSIPDIKILQEPSRFYPNTATATLVGLTDIDNNGIMGLELKYNDLLAGKPAQYLLERDARSGRFYFSKETHQTGLQGTSIMLTLDGDLQFLVQEELLETCEQFNAKSAAAVILDPANGDIIAMCSAPAFNPEDRALVNPETTKNIAIHEAYELGSVVKVLSAMAALEEGVVYPEELIDCKNTTSAFIEGRKINTVASSKRGLIPFTQVIAVSNNIGIAQVAMRLGTKLYDHYRRLGISQKTGIDLPGENIGFINPPCKWSKQSIISLSYGYEVRLNLLQLARAMGIIANNGKDCNPTLIYQKNDAKKIDLPQLYSPTTTKFVQEILELTTQEGTAKRAAVKGYRVICKTGTANMLDKGQYNPTKNLYTCAGIVQKGNYKRVIVVFVREAAQKNLYASTVAAPLFERVAEKLLIHDQVV